MEICQHEEVLVDCLHPWADAVGARVKELQAVKPSETRPFMTLANARCAACGHSLSRRDLKDRIALGGDLFDPRFVWRGLRSWWKLWG